MALALLVFSERVVTVIPRALRVGDWPGGLLERTVGPLLMPPLISRIDPRQVATPRNVERAAQSAQKIEVHTPPRARIVVRPRDEVGDGYTVDGVREHLA